MTPFEKERFAYQPKQPKLLCNLTCISVETLGANAQMNSAIQALFPNTNSFCPVKFIESGTVNDSLRKKLHVAVVFSGGQAPGGHNVIAGIYDALQSLNSESKLIGFLHGPEGILKGEYIDISENVLSRYRNQGGFDLIGSGRTKIETAEQFAAACKVVASLKLDGLVIIGGDDSNTNAAFLAEYFMKQGIGTKVVGVPKTIDGDLKNQDIHTSFGFDTASKVYSNLIGNIQRDALSAKKYFHFIKLMGRSASHIALECSLKTQPNCTVIGEEVESSQKTLLEIVKEISDLVVARAKEEKDYGVILIPEGLLEFCADCKLLIKEINLLVNKDLVAQTEEQKIISVLNVLTGKSKECFAMLPKETQKQLLLERDPHGNVNVSKIETEQLIIEMVKKDLEKRKKEGSYKGKFSPQPHFYGYEGRAAAPSNFDANYCYSLGKTASLLIGMDLTGYIACVKNLHLSTEFWEICAVPLTSMLNFEERHGKEKAVIKKAFVNLEGMPFKTFEKSRSDWVLNDSYNFPSSIQYFGPSAIVDEISETLRLES